MHTSLERSHRAFITFSKVSRTQRTGMYVYLPLLNLLSRLPSLESKSILILSLDKGETAFRTIIGVPHWAGFTKKSWFISR